MKWYHWVIIQLISILASFFVRVVYAHGCITAKIDTKLFNISKELAEKIRVVKISGE